MMNIKNLEKIQKKRNKLKMKQLKMEIKKMIKSLKLKRARE